MWDIAAGTMPLDAEAVVHCAAAVGQWGPRSLYWRTNVHGTQHVVDSMHPSARLVYVSTASVYPPAWSDAPIPETATDGARPTCVYGRSKLAGEQVALQRSGSTIVLRPHIVYGRGDSTLWPRVAAARRRESLAVPGNGTNRLSVTHIDNLVHAVVAVLRPEAAEGVYNVADEEAPTVDELLRTMFSRRDLPTTIRYVARPVAWSAAALIEGWWWTTSRANEPPLTRYAVASLADPSVLDISRARARLGYVPRWTFRDGPL
jgi:2-alkyl-3-oxoalkanoate reductase